MEENIDNTGTDKDEYYDILTTEDCFKDIMHKDKIEEPTEETEQTNES